MDETRAREVASWWHGGQNSALYAFCSSGYVGEGLAGEIRQCQAEVKAHIGNYTQDDIRQLRLLAEYVDNLPKPVHYHAGWNMVGYLPEMDPSYPFEDWESAQRSLIDDMDRAGDHYFDVGDDESKTLADDLSALMEDLSLDNGPGWDGYAGHMHYWITSCTEEECMDNKEWSE